jgi:Flp pilus assembly pilin Flp
MSNGFHGEVLRTTKVAQLILLAVPERMYGYLLVCNAIAGAASSAWPRLYHSLGFWLIIIDFCNKGKIAIFAPKSGHYSRVPYGVRTGILFGLPFAASNLEENVIMENVTAISAILRKFQRDEVGSVSVEFVMLTAAIAMLGVPVSLTINSGALSSADRTQSTLMAAAQSIENSSGYNNSAGTVNGDSPSGAGGDANSARTVTGDSPCGAGGDANSAGTVNGDSPCGAGGDANSAGTVNGDSPCGAGGDDNSAGTVNGDSPCGAGGDANSAGTVNGDSPSGAGGDANSAGTVNGDSPSGAGGDTGSRENTRRAARADGAPRRSR